MVPKVVLQKCYPKIARAASQRSLNFENFSLKLLQSWSGKMYEAAPQNCSPGAAPQSCAPKQLPQSCDSANLFTKTAPQSHSAKRLPKAAPQSCYRKLLSEVVCKATPESCSPKLFPCAAPQKCAQSCSPKLLPQSCGKLLPKVAAARSCQLVWKAVQSCSPKLFPGAAPQS